MVCCKEGALFHVCAAVREIEASAAKAGLEHPAPANELIESRTTFCCAA